MSPDREHLHHKLMDFGLDTRQILALVYSVCIALGAVAASTGVIGEVATFLALAAALVALACGFVFLHFAKERALNAETSK